MPTISWDKFTKSLVASGFTDDQLSIMGELIPSGFVDRLRGAGLDPKTFRLSVGEKVEVKEDPDQLQIPIFGGI